MLGRLLDLLTPKQPDAEAPTGPEQLQVATCAILLEVAHADDEFTDMERAHVVRTIRARFGLDEAQAHGLIEEALDARERATDIWHFTHSINEGFSVPEKLEVVEEIWRVVYADGTLDGHEDYLMHKLQKLLNFDHPTLIKAKLKVLQEVRGAREQT